MSQLDTLYRAFLNYRKEAAEDKSCQRIRKAAKKAAADKDLVESVRSRCTIEEDWICAIEEGLPFVEKAIREERQFIRQEQPTAFILITNTSEIIGRGFRVPAELKKKESKK